MFGGIFFMYLDILFQSESIYILYIYKAKRKLIRYFFFFRSDLYSKE